MNFPKHMVCKCGHWATKHDLEGNCSKCSCGLYETDFVKSTELREEAAQRQYDEWRGR